MTKTLKEFLAEATQSKLALFEHEIYKRIPGSKNSYRLDAANTNTKTQKHAHIYAKPKGGGKQLYSVNADGSGHDGSSGTVVPSAHADHFRGLGFDIADTNILESLSLDGMKPGAYELIRLEDA